MMMNDDGGDVDTAGRLTEFRYVKRKQKLYRCKASAHHVINSRCFCARRKRSAERSYEEEEEISTYLRSMFPNVFEVEKFG